MKIMVVCGAGPASQFTSDEPYAHITLRENNQPAQELADCPNRVGALRITCHDFRHFAQAYEPANEQWADQIPTPDMFRALPQFIADTLPHVKGYVINCGAGASRSSAMAVALGTLFGQSIQRFFSDPYNPNPMVVQCALMSFVLWPASIDWAKLYNEGPSYRGESLPDVARLG